MRAWTGIWLAVALAGNAAAACRVSEADGVKPDVLPSRVEGVAPLAVLFDASGTSTADSGVHAFHDLDYRWDFGDGASADRWNAGTARGRGARNRASGPIAAHVFESPGTYAVTLSVGRAKAECTIEVQDPAQVFAGEKTACFSISGTFDGCPEGAARIQASDFGTVTKAASAYNQVRRLLLRRGESSPWTASGPAVIRAPGPGLIGTFASGSAPVIRGTQGPVLQISDRSTPRLRDWRVVDLHLESAEARRSAIVEAGGSASQITLLRLRLRGGHSGLLFSISLLNYWNGPGKSPGHAIWDQIAMADSSISGAQSYGAFISARRLMLMGNTFGSVPAGGEHILRIPYLSKSVLGNNTMSGPASGKHALKMHALGVGLRGTAGAQPQSEQVIVSDNEFVGGGLGADYTATIGPQNEIEDERVRDVVIERNLFKAGAGTQAALVVWASDIAIRNNICDSSGGRSHACFVVTQRGKEPAPSGVRIFNNSCYSADRGDFRCITLGAPVSDAVVKNNLAYAPQARQASTLSYNPSTRVVESNNSTNRQVREVSPEWDIHFRLRDGSPYIDAGSPVPLHSDFSGGIRPQGRAFDVGASER